MRAGILAAMILVTAALVAGAAARAECLVTSSNSHARSRAATRAAPCVDFTLVPQISQQVVASERQDPAQAKPLPPAGDAKLPYTGPTVGVTPTVHKAPTVGYRWAIN